MGSFNVVFSGLMAHIENNGASRVVTVKEAAHITFVNVHEDDVLDSKGFPEKVVGVFFSFKLKGKFEFKGVQGGTTARQSTFDAHVPSVKKGYVLDKDLDADVINGNPSHGSIEAVIEYSGGTITAGKCFKARAKWDAGTNALPLCVADGTEYSVDPAARNVTKIRLQDTTNPANHYLEFPATAKIWISHRAPGNHFKHYAGLSAGSKARVPKQDGVLLCTDCEPKGSGDLGGEGEDDLECTNTRYP